MEESNPFTPEGAKRILDGLKISMEKARQGQLSKAIGDPFWSSSQVWAASKKAGLTPPQRQEAVKFYDALRILPAEVLDIIRDWPRRTAEEWERIGSQGPIPSPAPRPQMNAFKVFFEDGNTLVTNMNADLEQARRYYVGTHFNFGDTNEHPADRMVKAIKVIQL